MAQLTGNAPLSAPEVNEHAVPMTAATLIKALGKVCAIHIQYVSRRELGKSVAFRRGTTEF